MEVFHLGWCTPFLVFISLDMRFRLRCVVFQGALINCWAKPEQLKALLTLFAEDRPDFPTLRTV